MNLTEIQPYLALILGAIGTSLGLVNLIRDVRKNSERISVIAIPVIRRKIEDGHATVIGEITNDLNAKTSQNSWRNIGLKSVDALNERLESNEVPNLIGFEVRNASSHSIFLHTLGLAEYKNRNKFESSILDAIQEIKAERVEGDPIEIKPRSLFTTYLYIDILVSEMISNGYIYPVVETTSKSKRVYGDKNCLQALAHWLRRQ